jgi:hypothetical protein
MKTIWSGLNIKLLSLLLVCCLVLAAIVLGEWLYANYSYQNLLTSIEDIDEVADEIETMPEIKLAEKPQESYSAMVNRPLFTEGRKPVDETEENNTVQAFTGNIELILTGLVETPEGITAMLQDKKNNKHYRAKQGEEAQGWEVTKIETDKVIVEQGSNRKELILRKPKLVQPSLTPPKMKTPRRPARKPRTRNRSEQQSMNIENNDQL